MSGGGAAVTATSRQAIHEVGCVAVPARLAIAAGLALRARAVRAMTLAVAPVCTVAVCTVAVATMTVAGLAIAGVAIMGTMAVGAFACRAVRFSMTAVMASRLGPIALAMSAFTGAM